MQSALFADNTNDCVIGELGNGRHISRRGTVSGRKCDFASLESDCVLDFAVPLWARARLWALEIFVE